MPGYLINQFLQRIPVEDTVSEFLKIEYIFELTNVASTFKIPKSSVYVIRFHFGSMSLTKHRKVPTSSILWSILMRLFMTMRTVMAKFRIKFPFSDFKLLTRLFRVWTKENTAIVSACVNDDINYRQHCFQWRKLFLLNRYINKQNCRFCGEKHPEALQKIPIHRAKVTVLCGLWALFDRISW